MKEKFTIEMRHVTSYNSALTVSTKNESVSITHEGNRADGVIEEVHLTADEIEVLIAMLHKAWDNLR